MPRTKCPTVRSGGTTSMRSALIPMVMTSRASMDEPPPHYVVPAWCIIAHGAPRRIRREPALELDGRRLPNNERLGLWVPAFAGTTRGENPRYFFAAAARSTKVLPPFIL